jgi:transposase-like protein
VPPDRRGLQTTTLGFDAASFLVKDEAMSKRYPIEQRERAVKMVLDHLHEYNSLYAACQAIGPKLGIGAESLRVWTKQAQVDGYQVPGSTSAEQQRIKDLERENRDLKEVNAILKSASIFFARELDPRRR